MLRFVGEAANCKIVFHESPHFHEHRKISKDLNNRANKQAFIVTLRTILPGEELRWAYDISQPYRMLAAPPSPFDPITSPAVKRIRGLPRAAATSGLL
jgi:hypothetical protein